VLAIKAVIKSIIKFATEFIIELVIELATKPITLLNNYFKIELFLISLLTYSASFNSYTYLTIKLIYLISVS